MEHILEVRDVCKNYGKVQALNHVSLTLQKGIYALLGHNGAGKSTLMNVLTGIDHGNSGKILWNQRDIFTCGKEYRSMIGYMPQTQNLTIDLTVEDFLYYMSALKKIKKPKEEIERLLRLVNMYQYRKRRLNELSGGMKQRVMIAQALLNDPQFLFLDEPTAGLDPVERKKFRNLIASVADGKTILLATHVIADVEFIASRIIMMKDGCILNNATQSELLQNTNVYESKKDVHELLESNPELKIVNQSYQNGEIQTRFISKVQMEHQVSTTLDDVYIDWLE